METGRTGVNEDAESMPIADFDTARFFRRGRHLIAELLGPHRTLSTSPVSGGLSERVTRLVNHQSCEGSGHHNRYAVIHGMGPDAHHAAVCAELGLTPLETAVMGTAANMQTAAFSVHGHAETAVAAAVTAGVHGNAGRAGDPARWHEDRDGAAAPAEMPGTINIMLLFNWPLEPGALALAVATMAEAKAVALQELAVGSRYSSGLATGTGTDQFCLAAPLDPAKKPKRWTGKHAKLGEILALSVIEATREALRWQNGMETSYTRHLLHALGRFGLSEQALFAGLGQWLTASEQRLFRDNLKSVLYEPQVAASAYALAAVQDRVKHGVLPEYAAGEAMLNQAALMAAALAAKPEAFAVMRGRLGREPCLVPLVVKALALGWREKWI